MFLISGIIAAFLLPLLSFDQVTYVMLPAIENTLDFNFDTDLYIDPSLIKDTNETYEIDWILITTIIYSSGLVLFFIKICLQLLSVFRLIKSGNIVSKNKFVFIEVSNNINPFSFFNYIVYNPIKHSKEELEMILAHEQVHAGQKHSIDILITQSILCLQWFNPLAWFYKKSLEQNLEYLADNEAIQKTNNIKQYQHTLVKVSSTSQTLALINPFYQSFIKKRIVMLNKPQSHKRNLWKFTLVLPLLAIFMYSFNVKEVIEYVDEDVPAFAKAESNPSLSDATFYITKSSTPDDLDHIEKQIAQLYPDAKVRFSKRTTFGDGTIKQFSFQTKFKDDTNFNTRFNREKEITPDWKGYEINITRDNDIIIQELNENGVSFKLDIDKLTFIKDFQGTVYDRALVPANENYKDSSKGLYPLISQTNDTIVIDTTLFRSQKNSTSKYLYSFVITKNNTNLEIQKIKKNLKKTFNATLKIKNVKRNSKNEITSININLKDKDGNNRDYIVTSDSPIFNIFIYKQINGVVFIDNAGGKYDTSSTANSNVIQAQKRNDSLSKVLFTRQHKNESRNQTRKSQYKERRSLLEKMRDSLKITREQLIVNKDSSKSAIIDRKSITYTYRDSLRLQLKKHRDSIKLITQEHIIKNIKGAFVQTDEKAGYIKLDDTTYYYVKAENGNITYYDKWGQKIDKSDSIYNRLVNAPYFYVDNESENDVKKRVENYDNINTLLQTIAIYYLDGEKISYEAMKSIDPNTIAKINVLKGENAIELYGEEARNGVIIIETK